MRMARHGSTTRVSREVSVGLHNTLDKINHLPAWRKALRNKLEHAVEAISMGRACRQKCTLRGQRSRLPRRAVLGRNALHELRPRSVALCHNTPTDASDHQLRGNGAHM